jgi:hypothetical protein
MILHELEDPVPKTPVAWKIDAPVMVKPRGSHQRAQENPSPVRMKPSQLRPFLSLRPEERCHGYPFFTQGIAGGEPIGGEGYEKKDYGYDEEGDVFVEEVYGDPHEDEEEAESCAPCPVFPQGMGSPLDCAAFGGFFSL